MPFTNPAEWHSLLNESNVGVRCTLGRRLDKDRGSWNKKRRVSKVLSSNSPQQKHGPGYPVKVARSAMGVSMKLGFICLNAAVRTETIDLSPY